MSVRTREPHVSVVIYTIKRGDLIALVRKAQQGDEDALRRLYSDVRVPLMRLAQSRVGSSAAEDIVQETFSLAFRHLRSLRDPANFGPWLMQIARNCCGRWTVKHPQNHITIDEPEVDFLVDYSVRRTTLTPIDEADLRLDLMSILRELPEKYLLPLRLHYFREMTFTEIAVFTGLPVTTVKWRVHRSLEICRLLALQRNSAQRDEKT